MFNEATQQFLEAIWQYKPDDHYFLIWSKREDVKRSYWCREIEDASSAAEAPAAALPASSGMSLDE